MTKRKTISKRVRFEVFKRDNFSCQYCGAQSPDVVLHIDHINPVAGGGDNDIMNLVTSCLPCNLGKGARSLDDKTAIAKQRKQLQELNARREQLEMMVKWRESLASIADEEVNAFEAAFTTATGCTLNDKGRDLVKGWLKKHSLADVMAGLDGSLSTYYKQGDDDPEQNNRLAGSAISMVPRVIAARARYADKPYMKDLFYARAIIRNRMHCNEQKAIQLLERAYLLGAHLEDLKDWAKDASSWTNWHREMSAWIEELEAEAE